jgi:hypothetical protein
MSRSELKELSLKELSVRTLRKQIDSDHSCKSSYFEKSLDIYIPATAYPSLVELVVTCLMPNETDGQSDSLGDAGQAQFVSCTSDSFAQEPTVQIVQQTVAAEWALSHVPPAFVHGCQFVECVADVLQSLTIQIYLL